MHQRCLDKPIWDQYPEFFRGRWLVLHHLALELKIPDIEPPPVKQAERQSQRLTIIHTKYCGFSQLSHDAREAG